MCGLISKIKTDDISEKNSNTKACIVSGIISTGDGHSQLEELRATIIMPCFFSNAWIKYHAIVSDTAYRLRSEAVKEKTRIARLKGNSITTVFLVSLSSQLYHGLKSSIKIVASRDQQCFTSFYDLTTQMESNAIVEEFRCSLEMHDLKYTKLIGGGESTENSECTETTENS
ncbi:hypothetical protein HZH68_014989 [Vespula germanica]|uniref:Uncharacterized protein n=1 Tax=Vespula germanica TaxID=30212 RepID=A0A834J837_VESGE|nr:hypothetical protein HZH68_014989 [Vespula germanica]